MSASETTFPPRPAPDHPWRGQHRRAVERPAESERTCRACATTRPLGAFGRLPSGHRRRVCTACRIAAYTAQRRADPARHQAAANAAHRRASRNRYRHERRLAARRAAGWVAPPRRWWTVQRAAAELGLGTAAVLRRVADGRLVAALDWGHRRHWRIDPASVRALVDAN